MKTIGVFVVFCLFFILNEASAEESTKTYVIKILSNLEIEQIDVKGKPIKENATPQAANPPPPPTAPPTAVTPQRAQQAPAQDTAGNKSAFTRPDAPAAEE